MDAFGWPRPRHNNKPVGWITDHTIVGFTIWLLGIATYITKIVHRRHHTLGHWGVVPSKTPPGHLLYCPPAGYIWEPYVSKKKKKSPDESKHAGKYTQV
ncbi:hypothetical protein P175DRAFT_015754 [Aspergillus ochraceoroseus IBT 24754]|uniref:Uncharacterized protein n=1 Tax=Aspergillus ochraceoroseus IBT 24754 TaxID=1392256 RepID=A0A2T5M642_9EURO|nr:uncharacterized protein P175DRAFT_015754 [Aspergillus ochraceoroseus IBT 24754]PTU24005.1 hypothetical protein P175DRAFT_015754 [Aspergillus ochraceoroseus IBT 24754]